MLKRTAMKPSAKPMARGTGFKPKVAKPAKGPRPHKCAVKTCRKEFQPARAIETWCSPECGVLVWEKIEADKKAKIARADRAALKAFKDKNKRVKDYVAELQVVFNAWVRARDANQPCICCGKWFEENDPIAGGDWDAGHYLSRGHAPHLRFDERNVHRQIKGHNRPGGTTRISFRAGMIERIGLEALLALEADNTPRKYTIPDLIEMKAHYTAKLKAIIA